MGNFQEAVHMIQAALSWRAAAQITYLYGKRGTEPGAEPGDGDGDVKLKAISYLQQAFKLSNHIDFEACCCSNIFGLLSDMQVRTRKSTTRSRSNSWMTQLIWRTLWTLGSFCNGRGSGSDRGDEDVEEVEDPLESHDTDVPPCVLYWHGMYSLQSSGPEMVKKAKTLFDR
jgi:hypothetical protein